MTLMIFHLFKLGIFEEPSTWIQIDQHIFGIWSSFLLNSGFTVAASTTAVARFVCQRNRQLQLVFLGHGVTYLNFLFLM